MVEFGKMLFKRTWKDDFHAELKRMNDRKIGRPFEYPHSLIVWALTLKTFLKISYRLTLGIMNAFLEEEGFPPMGLTQFRARCMISLQIDSGDDPRFLAYGRGNVPPSGGKMDAAVDSTGPSLNKYGGWLITRWGVKKVSGWIKLHVATDVDTNEILAFVITTERCGDVTCLDKLMDIVLDAGHDVGSLLADAAYDSKNAWNRFSGMGIRVCINIKSSQLTERAGPTGCLRIRSHGCVARGKQMRRILEVGREEWKAEIGYHRRWKVECAFSDLKRILGDILGSRTQWSNVVETLAKIDAFNKYKALRKTFSGA